MFLELKKKERRQSNRLAGWQELCLCTAHDVSGICSKQLGGEVSFAEMKKKKKKNIAPNQKPMDCG